MDRLERDPDEESLLRIAFDGMRAGLWTAIPGIVQRFDAAAMTCEVQPSILMHTLPQIGNWQSVALPVLVDCPVQFPGAGGATMTFPVKPGDECLVVFASRCIDGWWQSGGVQPQAELRMHDLSDGFVLLGFRSRPRALANVSTSTAQLRSDDGATFIDLDPAGQKIKIVAPGGFEVDAPTQVLNASSTLTVNSPQSQFSGAVIIQGLLSWLAGMNGSGGGAASAVITGVVRVVGQILANGKRVDDSHTHGGVQPGSGTSGTVT